MKKSLLTFFVLLGCLLNHDYSFSQTITTIAGTGVWGYSGDGIPGTASKINNTPRIAVDACGNIYIGDAANHRVRKVDAITGIITTVAGTGVAGYDGEGMPATATKLNTPTCLAFDSAGNLYIGDGLNNRIRKVDAITGIITGYVGTGAFGFSGDGGPATAAAINAGDFAFDSHDNMYMCDLYRIRKIDAMGIITTIAGTGLPGAILDGVAATSTTVHPYPALCTDIHSNIYFVDTCGSVRKINTTTGIINRVAGNGISPGPYTGDGIAATACAMTPAGVYVDSFDNIYLGGYLNNICIKVDASGITHTIAGTGTAGYSGDSGPATAAKMYYPKGLQFDKFGHLYIADWNNARIRKITYPYTLTSPTITLSGVSVAALGSSVSVTAMVSGAGSSYIIRWMNHGIVFATTTIPTVIYTKPAGIDTITARVISTCGFYDSTTSAGHIVASETPSSILAQGVIGGVYIYPNPATDELHIDGAQHHTTYQLSNIVGAVVQGSSLKQGINTININHQPPGIYLLSLTDGEGRRTVHKIVKE